VTIPAQPSSEQGQPSSEQARPSSEQGKPSPEQGHVEMIFVHVDDLDFMGLLHNARYAILLERALTMHWDVLGYTFTSGAARHPDTFVNVAEYSIKYLRPVMGTGNVRVHFWVERLGQSSVVYAFQFLAENDSTVHAEGRRVHIKFDPRTLRPAPWEAETRKIYESLMAVG
jgi:acyl-CoA thioester hydrolase